VDGGGAGGGAAAPARAAGARPGADGAPRRERWAPPPVRREGASRW